MKKIIIVCFMFFAAIAGHAQKDSQSEIKQAAKSEKQQKEEIKKAGEEATAKMVETMITDRQFILEVEFMNDQARNFLHAGAWININPIGNYLAVNDAKIVVMFEPNENQTSNWPFGKFPSNDTFSNYKVTKPQKTGDSYFVSFRSDGKIGPYDITMNVALNGKTQLTMKNNLGLSLNLKGVLVPLKKSKINPVFI
jgi:hypothetical protein